MNDGIILLDEAIELARQERLALQGGEYEEAIAMAKKRDSLTSMAYNLMSHANEEPYRIKLLELSRLQQELVDIATQAHATVRQSLNRSKLEQKRMRGYHMAIGQALQ